jgi:hypothetical protein
MFGKFFSWLFSGGESPSPVPHETLEDVCKVLNNKYAGWTLVEFKPLPVANPLNGQPLSIVLQSPDGPGEGPIVREFVIIKGVIAEDVIY